jgi:hypothetical protein
MHRLAVLAVLVLILGGAVPAAAQGPGNLKPAPGPLLGASAGAAAEKQVRPAAEGSELVSIIVAFDASIDADDLEAASRGKVIYRYSEILNGASLLLTRDAVPAVAGLAGVTAIYFDRLVRLETDSSPAFIGAPAMWEALGGQGQAGEGVVVGVIDSGIWPEHPSFSDPDLAGKPYPQPPIEPGDNGFGGGRRRPTCAFGNRDANRLDAEFTCNNKLIAAYRFQDTYRELRDLLPGEFASARDSDGHGTYVASIAAGNAGIPASLFGAPTGRISGIAPRAHLIVYRTAAGPGGESYTSDVAAAIEQAILDGVDVLNYAMDGGEDPYGEVPSLALLAAYERGVFVAAPAGNGGPEPGSVGHREPWVMSVAASSQGRTLAAQPLLELGGSFQGLVASSSPMQRAPRQGDVMADFSGRGGPEETLGISKPDATAPGVEVLAGDTPAPAWPPNQWGGDLFQAQAGTSASAAHIAGAAALLADLHPDWMPGQIQSALMMTARTEGLVQADGTTPATPFDYGSGRIDLAQAAQASLTIAPEAQEFLMHQEDLVRANYPSLYVAAMPGTITVQRTVHNSRDEDAKLLLSVFEPEGMTIGVPNQVRVPANGDAEIEINVRAVGVPLDEVRHTAIVFEEDGLVMRMPVTIVRRQPAVSLESNCTPALMPQLVNTNCTITLTNTSEADATVLLSNTLHERLALVPGSLSGATMDGDTLAFEGMLAGSVPPLRLTSEPALYGYLPLEGFGLSPAPCPEDCDDGGLFVSGLDFVYQDIHYDEAIWSVNGTLELGTSSGIAALGANTALPDPALPNNLLAPWWTDLDLSAGGEWYTGALTDGATVYDVFEWRDVPRYGDERSRATFQIWLARGTNLGWFTYGSLTGDVGDATTGFEGAVGTAGQTFYHGEAGAGALPRGDLHLDQNSGRAGETHLITFTAEGAGRGRWQNCASMSSDLWDGEAVACTVGQVLR